MFGILQFSPSPLMGRRGVDLDFPLLAGCLALLGLGLVMIASASSEVAAVATGNPLYHTVRHLFFLVLGLGAAAVSLHIPMATWQRWGGRLLLAAFGLLMLVLVVGREVNGATRWIGMGMFNLQPSEVAKVFVVVYLASYLVRRQEEVRESWWGFLKPIGVLIPMAGLLLLEPDFGATVVMLGAGAAMLFLGGVGLFRFAVLAVAAVAAVFVLVQSQEYRLQRLITFTDPWADQYGAGYQLTQALIAFGRGEWFGVGLGNSIQKQFYLPEAHTDFVFAVLAEELGMIGALATVGLFVFVSVRALYIGLAAERANQLFSACVAYGLAFLWIGQFLINIGVNIGLLPTKGLTLPFLSYGGSSLVICCVSLAMLLRIEWESRVQLGNEDVELVAADFPEDKLALGGKHGR
jgi:cell division protein FtsW